MRHARSRLARRATTAAALSILVALATTDVLAQRPASTTSRQAPIMDALQNPAPEVDRLRIHLDEIQRQLNALNAGFSTRKAGSTAAAAKKLASDLDPATRPLSRLRTPGARETLTELSAEVRSLEADAARLQRAGSAKEAGPILILVDERVVRLRAIIDRLAPFWAVMLYQRRIAETNECTLLVKKVCGEANECSTSPGCPVAMQILERYEGATGQEKEELAESCLAGLEDAIVFNQCVP